MKKQLPTDVITKELSQSVFFQKPAGEPSNEPTAVERLPSRARSNHSPLPSSYEQPHEAEQQNDKDVRKQDVMLDVVTSSRQNINLKDWQEIIENTETQNSALRLTSAERYAVEDAVSELRRKYGIKTSMNEVARLGLLVLVANFKQQKKASLIHQVKKA